MMQNCFNKLCEKLPVNQKSPYFST